MLGSVRERQHEMQHRFADGAHDRTGLMDKAAFLDPVIDQQSGFAVIPPPVGHGAYLSVDDPLAKAGKGSQEPPRQF